MNGRMGPTEPSADIRTAAATSRQLFIGMIDEGFTEDQALRVLIGILQASMLTGGES